MNHRERTKAILHYEKADRLPIVHFGFWRETLDRWAREGHLSQELAESQTDGNPADKTIETMLGFDFNWQNMFYINHSIRPAFTPEVLRQFEDGTRHERNAQGVVVVCKPEAGSIPAEISHTLTDRASWEEHYRWRYQWHVDRLLDVGVRDGSRMIPFRDGGLELLKMNQRTCPLGLHCGSLFGEIRNILGVEGSSYLYADDEPLFDEIIQTVGDLCYQGVKTALESGAKFDFGHFWEDICFKNGPLIIPSVFHEKVGPHYRRITQLLAQHEIDIVSLDCDGQIDALIPTWIENGVNTMFPIEVGTWDASILPWRERYGRALRGVGGMNKVVFSRDRNAVDREIERLKPLVALGGYIPCPDHRLAPDSQWDLVRYYTDRMHAVFG